MYRILVIAPDESLGAKLAEELEGTGVIGLTKTVNNYPNAADLTRALRVHSIDAVFLSFAMVEEAVQTVRLIEADAAHMPIVGFHNTMDPSVLRESMRAGVREFIAEPFDRHSVMEALSQIKTLLDRRPSVVSTQAEQIFTFLPSKAGVGTSTIAANVAAALARNAVNQVLLSDFDLNSGMLRFMLNLKNEYSVSDAMNFSFEMEEEMWPQLVTSVNGMDVLHAGRINPNMRIEPTQIRNLIQFLRRRYKSLCFDLSGNLEKYSIELMQESKRILLVCTPEIPSLHLAREKVQFLKQLDLDGRISIVLNRVSKKPLLSVKLVEQLVGLPVVRIFPNDYLTINQCVTEGALVPKGSILGKAFAEFADSLSETASTKSAPQGRKFLEMITAVAPLSSSGRN